jgi:hypothetical protein
MSIATKFRSVFRGQLTFTDLVRETFRRRRAAGRRALERHEIDAIAAEPARLSAEYASLSSTELLAHFRCRRSFLFAEEAGGNAKKFLSAETAKLLDDANRIVQRSQWELAGFGVLEFTGEDRWRRDPLGSKVWGLEYHADVNLFAGDGADIRVLWELNRLGHVVTLACAYAVTGDEQYAETTFTQIEEWVSQNPYGRGANWQCAMEVALRSINLLAAFDLMRSSSACTEERLALLLNLFDQHGRNILDNNEFSYFATSNHYLSDVVGLFWIGTCLPELQHAEEWRRFGLSEIIREMHKQVLADGADFESSTGYHKFVAEMLLLTFLLARKNSVEVSNEHWQKLRTMFDFLHGIIRPDAGIPLIGDADGSQIVPVVKRDSDDAAYLLALAAVAFDEPKFTEFAVLSPEILWFLGGEAVKTFNAMERPAASGSAAFPQSGAYVLRDCDLYLHLNANDTGTNGRGSHAHNDALSIEVSAFGSAFIVDPGSCVYNLDRETRHRFRSTAYHSTVMIDGKEQNRTYIDLPFVLGNEAKPELNEWKTGEEKDRVSARHFGYERISDPVIHRRTVQFDKRDKYWTLTDELTGRGKHDVAVSFHLASGVSVETDGETARLSDLKGNILLIRMNGLAAEFQVLESAVSRNYGDIRSSFILRMQRSSEIPLTFHTAIVPVRAGQKIEPRLALLDRVADNTDS